MFPDHFSLNRRQRQYRHVIELDYEPGGVVCLVERHLQLEVHYSCSMKHKKLRQECTIIRNHVLESIRLTEEKLHIREGAITKVDSFLCSCGKGRAHHICAYNPETHIVECEVTREVFDLETQHQLWLGVWYNQNCSLCWYMWYCIDVGGAMVTTTHSIHCAGSTSGSHELPPPAAAAEGEHCILVWLGQPQLVHYVLIQRVWWIENSTNSVYISSHAWLFIAIYGS